MSVQRMFLVAVLLALAPAAQAAIYKWVDEDGNVHYGERPPLPDATPLAIPNQPEKARPGAERERLERQKRMLEGYARKRAEERRQREEAARKAEQRKRACIEARDKFQAFERARYLYRLDENGERVVLNEEERAARMEKLRDRIRRNCKDGQ